MPNFERFWRKVGGCSCGVVEVCAEHCWEWQGARNYHGYGSAGMRLYEVWTVQAHRVSWIMHNRRVPEPGVDIVQTCGNRLCCNPSHLVERPHAQRNYGRKLTAEQQTDLLQMYQAGWPVKRIAAHFKISPSSVRYRIRTLEAKLIHEDCADV